MEEWGSGGYLLPIEHSRIDSTDSYTTLCTTPDVLEATDLYTWMSCRLYLNKYFRNRQTWG